jgi:hypothetical protein
MSNEQENEDMAVARSNIMLRLQRVTDLAGDAGADAWAMLEEPISIALMDAQLSGANYVRNSIREALGVSPHV